MGTLLIGENQDVGWSLSKGRAIILYSRVIPRTTSLRRYASDTVVEGVSPPVADAQLADEVASPTEAAAETGYIQPGAADASLAFPYTSDRCSHSVFPYTLWYRLKANNAHAAGRTAAARWLVLVEMQGDHIVKSGDSPNDVVEMTHVPYGG
jgi:hypothetical protein